MPEFQLESTPQKFRKVFLLAFTKELIKNSVPELKEAIEKKEKKLIEQLFKIEKIKETFIPSKVSKPAGLPLKPRIKFKALPKPFKIPKIPPRLKIPFPKLPERLKDIKPVPRPEIKIDLGKLNPLIDDPVVQTIECNGPNEKIIIRDPSQKVTDIVLSKEEIDDIIQKFSDAGKIPITEGVFRVAVGKLVLSAIVSNVVGSKFIIKKLRYTPLAQPGLKKLMPPKVFIK